MRNRAPCGWASLLLALGGIHLGLTFESVWSGIWPTPWVRPGATLSVELALLVLTLAWLLDRGRSPGRGLRTVLAALLVLAVLGRYAEVTAPALFGRPVNLYWDARHLPRVAAMALEIVSAPTALAVALGVLLGAVALWWLARQTVVLLLRGLAEPGPRRAAAVLAAGVVLTLPLAQAGVAPEGLVGFTAAASYARQVGHLAVAWAPGSGTSAPRVARSVVSDLGRLEGADLFVIFLESYGASVFDRPDYARALWPAYARFERAIVESGRRVVSARVTSPTFGGSSWLAHASLLTGVEVADQGAYERLLASGPETLAHRLRGAGYRAVGLLPGLQKSWPEGQAYGLDRLYDAPALDYRGPAFGWWRLTDEWSLACLHAREVAVRERPPLFVFFATVNTHFPFLPIPPYRGDWAGLCGPAPYAGLDLSAVLGEAPDWTAMGPAFVRAVDYALEWLGGYLRGPAPRDAVFVVLGDHQPAASISGAGAGWEVPVHVIAPAGAVLDTLEQAGFVEGLRPAERALAPMARLRDLLLRSLHRG